MESSAQLRRVLGFGLVGLRSSFLVNMNGAEGKKIQTFFSVIFLAAKRWVDLF
jgi:hypothetical protein